jgi:WD domain, G-beta repeat
MAARSAGVPPRITRSAKMRPGTYSITKKHCPDDGFVHAQQTSARHRYFGRGQRAHHPVFTVHLMGAGQQRAGRLLAKHILAVRLWDAATGQPIGAPMTGHTSAVRSAAFSPDGRDIVSGSDDHTVCIWDAMTTQQVGAPIVGQPNPDSAYLPNPIIENHESIVSVAFSDDRQRILSAGARGTVWVWPGPAAWKQELCAKLTTNMSHQQWRDWVSPDIAYITVCPDLPVAPD